ncbi:MAG TPA: nitroreductase family deazaflavin-dependent oxidoreductase [Dehalococcoidia bacterium]|nr:nitroreductase family deazaflavin-dependent oxidoreductase [Dehalococcoidia bacterium]
MWGQIINPEIEQALQTDLVVDITTTGRQSGKPRRIEIWLRPLDDHFIIAGPPGPRDWFANLNANPSLTIHLKKSIEADLPAHARPLTDPEEKRRVLEVVEPGPDSDVIDEWVANCPIVEVRLD